MKPASRPVTIGKKIKILVGEYLSHLAITSASYVKKPALDRAVTMTNIPKRSPMVSQLTKPIDSLSVNILNMSNRSAPMNATTVLFTFSVIIVTYVRIKITSAIIVLFNARLYLYF